MGSDLTQPLPSGHSGADSAPPDAPPAHAVPDDRAEPGPPATDGPLEPVAPRSRHPRLVAAVAILVVAVLLVRLWPASPAPLGRPSAAGGATAGAVDTSRLTILAGAPSSVDPARHGDLASASYVSQLFESLTAADPSLQIRPALAESWAVADDGRRITFTLRPNLTFSDGTRLTAGDVVHSWRRLVNPRAPSPLASLIADVRGVRGLLDGASGDPATLGVRAEGDSTVVVDLLRGGGDLPAIVSSAPFGIVPPSVTDAEIQPRADGFVGSGAYVIAGVDGDGFTLAANPYYWAGAPAIPTVRMLTTLGGRSEVDAFAAGDVDYTEIHPSDAGWIAYDRTLGPALRGDPSLSVTYFGFDTRRPPFDDVRVRRAVARAVDWRRLAALDEPGSSAPASAMVPGGVAGAPAGDYLPPYDPAGARALLAAAGHANGAGLAPISFVAGTVYDEAVVSMLRENLGVTVDYATMPFDAYTARLERDPPGIWAQSWIADYPGPNDFLGVLLGTGSTANAGRWSSPAFDAAIDEATSSPSPAAATAAFARAAAIVRDEVPTIPVSYGTSWSLARDRLLGASTNGTGILRLAGVAWGPGS